MEGFKNKNLIKVEQAKEFEVDEIEKSHDEFTRRDLLTALVSVGAMAAVSPRLAESNRSRLEDELEKKLEEARQSIPEGVPVKVDLDKKTGELVYSRVEDEVTTETLYYLSGRGEVTDSKLAEYMHKDMFDALVRLDEDVASKEVREYLFNIDTKEEMVDFYVKYFDSFTEDLTSSHESKETFANYRLESNKDLEIEKRRMIKPEFYQFLWQLFVEAGAPRIEPVDTYEELSPGRENLSVYNSRYNYSNEKKEGIIYLYKYSSSSRKVYLLLQELAHMIVTRKDFDATILRQKKQKEFMGDKNSLSEEEKKRREDIIYSNPVFDEGLVHKKIVPILLKEAVVLHPGLAELVAKENPELNLQNS